MLTANDIHIRDPFILPVPEEGAYYLYGTVGTTVIDGASVMHFAAFRTTDLVHFEDPVVVFHAHEGFWADSDYWAPEVHRYNGRYYMFASFKAEGKCRGTQILVCDRPDGVFTPISAEPVTPRDWECLDGTLYVSPDGKPYMVFCHEWVQIHDGTICTIPLSDDLTHAVGDAVTLFSASEPAWAPKDKSDYVTDGPFVFRMNDGTLAMLWSSFVESGYAQVLAVSPSGSILGPWVQKKTPLFTSDGGHGMIFTTFDGRRILTLHSPNHAPEHPRFFSITEKDGVLTIAQ